MSLTGLVTHIDALADKCKWDKSGATFVGFATSTGEFLLAERQCRCHVKMSLWESERAGQHREKNHNQLFTDKTTIRKAIKNKFC